jgi:thiol-disulfide isomerase/thioredoxin
MSEEAKDLTSIEASSRSTRQRRLYLGVGLAAAALGAVGAWRRFRPHEVQDPALQALWEIRLEAPTGSPIALKDFRGKPLLINFWATWCPPCIEEFPLLDAFYREQSSKGWQVLGLAIDQPSAVRKFLEKLPVSFPIALAGLEGTELGRSLGNETGGLPFTVVVGADGRLIQRKIGKLDPADLQALSRII